VSSARHGRLLALAALAIIAASLLPLGARAWWVLDLATHFRVQYAAAALVLIVLFALRRRYAWCAALAASAAISLLPVLPYLPLGTRPAIASTSGRPVEVLTANLLFRNHSAERFLEIVREQSPDVVVLVEYTEEWAGAVGEIRHAYPYRFERSDRGAYGIALFSRYPLDNAAPLALGRSLAVEATVRPPGEAPFTLVGVHLRSPTTGWRAGQRNWQFGKLAARLAELPGPVVVTGDFNITPYSPYFTEWLAQTGLTDARARHHSLAATWPAPLSFLGIPIDHFVVSDDIEVVSQRRLPAFGSDHYPILAELAVRERALR
jgi:endonuclease/exonuclease/phosphatase (EEP) superfamily protein YafD